MPKGYSDSLRNLREAGMTLQPVTKTVTPPCPVCAVYHERGHRLGRTAAERQRSSRKRRAG